MNKEPTAFRLSKDARQLLKLMADKNGISMAAVLELAIRKMAAEQGVVLEVKDAKEKIKTKK